MLFPNSYQTILGTDSTSIDAVAVKNGALFVVLSTDAVTLWHAETLLQLFSIRRVTDSLESTGFNRRIVLREDDKVVIVQTTGNVLLIYDLCESSDPEDRVFVTETSPGAPKVWLKHRQNIRVEAGVQALCATAERLTLVTKKPAMIQTVDWNNTSGEVLTKSFALSKIAFLLVPDHKFSHRLVELVHSAKYDVFLFVMSNGNVFVTRFRQGQWAGRLLHQSQTEADQAILATFNDHLGVLTMSLSGKSIVTYVVPTDFSQPVEQLSLQKCAFTVGSLRSISWSFDGTSLLVCSEHGWSLLSPMGYLVAESSLPIPITPSSEAPEKDSRTEEMLRLAIWIRGSHSVLFVPISNERLLITDFSIEMSCSLRHPDRLEYKWESSALSFLHQNTGTTPWAQLSLHRDISAYGPLMYSSISKCRKHIVIGAKHGLGLYSSVTDVWKTYRDTQQAASISLVLDPIWYQHLLVVALRYGESGQQLRLMSRTLDLEDVLDIVPVSGSMVAMASKNEYVYICYSDYRLEQYQIVRTRANTIKLLLRTKHGLVCPLFRPDVHIRSFSIIHESGSPPRVHLRILQGDLLWLVHLPVLPDEQPIFTLIAKGLEWQQGVDGVGPLKNAVFGFDGQNMNIWFNLLSYPITANEAVIAPSVTFKLDYYPLAVSLESGLIDGLSTMEISATPLLPSSWSSVNAATSFIPVVLETLLRNRCHGEAVVVASRYSHLAYFDHFMEILLNGALESEEDHHSEFLESAWGLIQNYPHLLPKVVVGVARKSESAYWSALFNVTGNAYSLYTAALKADDLKTAGAFLIVLYTMDPEMNHEEITIELMKKAMSKKDWNLAIELSSFYTGVAVNKPKAMDRMRALLDYDGG